MSQSKTDVKYWQRTVFRAFSVVAAVTLAGVALTAGPEHLSARSSKSQIVAENPDASNNHGIAMSGIGFRTTTASVHSQARSGKNPIAEKYDTLVMRVYFGDRAERDRLAQELNAEEVPTTGGYLTVINDRDLYYDLTARGLRVEIDETSSRNLSDPQILRDTFYSGYKSVEEIYAFLDQKVAQFPTLVEKIDIGDSWCKANPGSCVLPSPWNGYDLYVLHITNRNIPGPKPVFWADGDIHAREIATPEVIMRMIDHLLNNYDTNADVHWLLDHHDIWLMPEVNPDGHHIVEAGGGGNSPYLYRKNGNNSGGGGCSWPPTSSNHFGVDNNRNFPFHWGCCNGSSGLLCAQTYRGTSAGSEPEDMAIVNKIRTLVPDQRGPGDTDPAPITATGVYQNIHTVVPVNLYTWGWSSTQMPNYAETNNIAAHMAAPNAGGNGYPYGSIINQLYVVDGGSIDWAYGELGMAAFSTELSGQNFLPSYSCIDNPGCGSSQGIWPENRGMLLYLAKIARTPYLTSHGPDANTVVTNPASVPQGVPSQLTASINFAWSNNAFSQNVGAAEYYIDTPPWAGGTAIPMNGTFNAPTVAVNATINTGSLPVGRHVIFVRGRGVSDFQGFETWGPISAAFLDVTGGPTPTPGVTPAPTSTPTPAATPTPPLTPTPTPTPPPLISISGTVLYCSNPVPGPVPNVTLNLTGSTTTSTTTNGSGNYIFSSLASGGTYTVTPGKGDLPPGLGTTGIDTADALLVQKHFLSGGTLLTGCALNAARTNANNLGDPNTSDALFIQQFFLFSPNPLPTSNRAGEWRFSPVNRTYPGVNSDQASQNYDAYALGDVNGDLTIPVSGPSDFSTMPMRVSVPVAVTKVALPNVDISLGDFVAAVTTSNIAAGDKLQGFQGDFTFDSSVVTFQSTPVAQAGLTANGNWALAANVLGTGTIKTLRVSCFALDANSVLSGEGPLFELRMTRVSSKPGASTQLIWAAAPNNFMFLDDNVQWRAPASTPPGSVAARPATGRR